MFFKYWFRVNKVGERCSFYILEQHPWLFISIRELFSFRLISKNIMMSTVLWFAVAFLILCRCGTGTLPAASGFLSIPPFVSLQHHHQKTVLGGFYEGHPSLRCYCLFYYKDWQTPLHWQVKVLMIQENDQYAVSPILFLPGSKTWAFASSRSDRWSGLEEYCLSFLLWEHCPTTW